MIFVLALAAALSAQAAPVKNPPSTLACAPAGDDGDPTPARLVMKAGGGRRLFVCAVNAKKKHGQLEVSGFRVFSAAASGKKSKKPIFESDLDTKTYRVSTTGKELHASELVSDGQDDTPALETVVSCDTKGCRASTPPKCVFEKPKPGSRRALELAAEFQHGAKQGKVPSKKLIDSLAVLAYSGDADAQALFRDRGAMSLDGEVSDVYFDHQASLERLQKAGCL